ncbi:PD-(D/E)XK nuclease family protein [Patescibacteria group bacterium]|nr:PD-(D/E)XK nuclease family protein [Patescibacteria group bacterium]
MSEYYRGKRGRDLFDPTSSEPYKLSRSKIDNFIKCPRCFYIDRRLGVGQPPGYPFSLNSAVDLLLKKEFDVHRADGTSHPLMKAYGLDAVPYQHEDLETWRNAYVGVRYLHPATNLLIYGGIDDVWVNPAGELIIVDYKATSKDAEVSLDAAWQDGYKRQVEIYQWLFRQNGFKVSDTAYFVYCNGKRDAEAFDAKLEFDIKLIPYVGKTDWIDATILGMKECLVGDDIPDPDPDCDFCKYRYSVEQVVEAHEYPTGKK